MENEKTNYEISDDPGHPRKVVFICKDAFPDRNLAKVMPLVEQAGNEEKYRGFHASAPTIYCFMDNFHQQIFEPFYEYNGSLYARHNSHSDLVVFCFEKKLSTFELGSSVGYLIKSLMSEFPQRK